MIEPTTVAWPFERVVVIVAVMVPVTVLPDTAGGGVLFIREMTTVFVTEAQYAS